MTDVGFYHLTKTPLEQALPKLLEKILAAKKRAVVKLGSQERLGSLDAFLWNSGRGSFLPHGSKQDGNAADQLIWLTTEDENPNGAQILLLTEDLESSLLPTYERCLDIFDGNSSTSVEKARNRWKGYKSQNHQVVYWKQSPRGSWEKG